MSIQHKIRINTHYTRSVNLERDANSLAVVDAYIPTTRALRTLESMAAALLAEESPRAWSLVGPYGSGKSSFAVFLAHLLGDPRELSTRAALRKLGGTNRGLGAKYRNLTWDSAGFCTVLLTGSPESFGRRLVHALSEKAEALLHGRCKIIQELAVLAERKEQPTTSEIIDAVKGLQDALASRYSGIVIAVDELGKFLEYEARHYGANDIFLLQALAEHALGNHAVRLSLVVMLHQAFEQYARGLGEALKNEWAKVQGRFENIPFLESAEQTLRIVGAAIKPRFSNAETSKIQRAASQIAKTLNRAKAIPGTMDESTAADLFARCYPLHPISALLLPILCQKVAQNERTLFSYLGSREAHGFQHGVTRCEEVGEWIYPWEIYEYFIRNQSAALTDHFTHRRWAEVVTATERLGDAHDDEARILKAIGLLNIIGAQGGFKASTDVVRLCLTEKATVDRALKGLTEKSIIQYRKFSSEYRVWQGSDFDLDANVETELQKLGRFGLADSLNKRHSLVPIVARKYTIQSGALRYFYPIFVDAHTLHQLNQSAAHPRIVFYLAESKDDEETFKQTRLDSQPPLDIRVLCLNSDQLRETVAEVLALEAIQKTAQELNFDPVARLEFKDRYNATVAKEEDLLDRLTSEPQLNRWYWKANTLAVKSKRSLQEALSHVLNSVYSKSPVFMNELINRDKPSAQANAAKNKLAIAMFNKEAEPDLGIDKFPPEKAIYRACLRESKLHVQGADGNWLFQGPKSARKSDDPCNIYPVWQRIDAFLDGTEHQAKSLIELNLELMAPPFGIKEGMLPILYMAVLMANQQELAIYEGRIYTPYLSEEQIERFLKRPDEFTVQRFRITGMNLSIHEVYSSTLYSDGKHRSILALARPIARMVFKLPSYTQTTQAGLTSRAQAVRNVFKLSKSPIKLMLEELPISLGINLVWARDDEDELKKLSKRLMDTLKELQYCLPNLKNQFREMLAQAFSQDKDIDLVDLHEAVAGRCRGLEDYTIDRDGLKAFIQRALKSTDDPDLWLDELLSFLGQKPADKWGDADRDAAEYRLAELTRKLTELERLRLHYQDYATKADGDFDVYLLRSVKKGAPDYDEVVAIDKRRHDAIKSIKAKMLSTLREADSDLRMAALAEIVDIVLAARSESTKSKPVAKANKMKWAS